MRVRPDSGVHYYLSRWLLNFLMILVLLVPNISQANTKEEWLALNIYHEARGEGFVGKIAVGVVTLNRVGNDDFPDTIKEVITQKKQFSWYNNKKRSKKLNKSMDMEAYNSCLTISTTIIRLWDIPEFKEFIGQTGIDSVKWYHKKNIHPYWARRMERLFVIENHVFYRGFNQQLVAMNNE